jgi:gluconate 2-dehydrogenase gamma chain
MNRRDSIKAFVVGTMSVSAIAEGCDTADKKPVTPPVTEAEAAGPPRMPEEKEWEEKIRNQKFFTDAEMASVVILSDIIIPKDEKSGSATDAKVPAFIDFIALDKPDYQTPLRGGLRWLDMASLKAYDKSFADCSPEQRIAIVDRIAYPKKFAHGDEQGVAFFSMIRNLVVTGFFTSKMGYEDIGYVGNQPNQWNGVPDDVLKQYNISYSEKELKECVSFTKA